MKSERRVLFVEDEISQLELVKLLFINSPIDLILASKLADAKKIIDNYDVDLVLLDLKLSKNESGIDVLKYLTEKKKTPKVIIVSGWIDKYEEEILKYKKFKMDFLCKPYSVLELKEKINDFFDL